MTVIDKIRQRILKFLKLDYNPNDERNSFISDSERIKKQQLEEYRVWYLGDSNELLNYYTNEQLYGNNHEPIYNRNRRNYFWSISATEYNIKRVHSGVPNAIVSTLTNAIGNPITESADKEIDAKLNRIKSVNNFENILNQQQMPLTMVEGWGAYKVNLLKDLSSVPLIQYYSAQDCDFIYKSGILIGIIYRDYYAYKDKNYVLVETRRVDKNNSYVEYELFELFKNDEASPVELNTIPDLADLQNVVIEGYGKILGVPTKFFFDPLNKNYGRSIYAGKIDLFDDLDQILSQDSQTVRVSTPVEYYPVDLLERAKNGQPQMPKIYNRQFIKKEGVPNGDGSTDGTIQTTQPKLNFDQYNADARAKLDFILTGILSPATMGIDLSKRDNADAQREKEKVTIMTRNNIISAETKIIAELLTICLDLQEYLDTGTISPDANYMLTVKFNEFANPSFENEIQILGQMWLNGAISTKRYVELLWGDRLSDEEKVEEILAIENQRREDNLALGEIENGKDLQAEILSGEEDEPPSPPLFNRYLQGNMPR